MDYSQAFAVSAAGMSAERTRVEVAALNLANANTVQPAGGAGFQPLRVVLRAAGGFDSLVTGATGGAAATGPVASIENVMSLPRMVYEPGHPLADTRGFVRYAAVDAATEMVTLMSAMRSYEANVAAMNTARSLVLKTLEIGRSS
jgi:flagellar basal-body rod protein FlgC